jgi:hypothetical protein
MADAPQKVSTPDGREWLVSSERRKRSMKESRETPLFWAHVVATAIFAGVMIWIFRHNTGILFVLVVVALLLWGGGFIASTFGLMIRAETKGPPPEHRLWKVTKRSAHKQAQQEVVAAIGRGDLTAEPPNTRLEEI